MESKDTWGEYSKLVLRELERLNESHEKMRTDFYDKLDEMNLKLNDVKNIEKSLSANSAWIDKVSDVWSPSQMLEAKKEIYRQKNILNTAIGIIAFIQIMIGIGVALWNSVIK
jgi:hypothetical protein